MNGMKVGKMYWYGTITSTKEYNFSPQYVLAWGTISAVGFGSGNAECVIKRYRVRQPDGSDQTHSYSGDYWDSPNAIGVDNVSSVTFETWINEGGYVVASPVITFW